MSGQVETFLGWTGLGFGVLLAYGAYKNVPVLGPSGLLTQALTTGKVPTVPKPGTVGPPAQHTGKTLPQKRYNYENPLTPSNPLTVIRNGVHGAQDLSKGIWHGITWVVGNPP
jgi:hypothetical protein